MVDDGDRAPLPNARTGSDCSFDILKLQHERYSAEIRHKSELQDSLVRMHITTLTAVVGAGLVSSSIGPWVLLLIPAETVAYGWWYINQDLEIAVSGRYIRRIEREMTRLACDQSMVGIEHWRNHEGESLSPQREYSFKMGVHLILFWPAVIALLVTLLTLVGCSVSALGLLPARLFLPLGQPLSNPSLLLAFIAWVFELVLTIAYSRVFVGQFGKGRWVIHFPDSTPDKVAFPHA